MSTPAVDIRYELPEDDRERTSAILCEAFQGKLRTLGSVDRAREVLAFTWRSDRSISAYLEGRLVGIAGVDYADRDVLDLRWWPMIRRFGLFHGSKYCFFLWLVSQHDEEPGLFLSMLAVDAESRGLGIGTELLVAAETLARREGLDAVSLTVVDSNPRAQALYERVGYEVTKCQKYPFARQAGFSQVITMVKRLDGIDSGRSDGG